jgi:hypothetical protein
VEELLTTVGTGEAIVTVLTRKGAPTPPVATHLIAPSASMKPLPEDEMERRLAASRQVKRYGAVIDNQSAREMLEARIAEATRLEEAEAAIGVEDRAATSRRKPAKPAPGGLEKLLKTRAASNMGTQLVRSAMGVLERYLKRKR